MVHSRRTALSWLSFAFCVAVTIFTDSSSAFRVEAPPRAPASAASLGFSVSGDSNSSEVSITVIEAVTGSALSGVTVASGAAVAITDSQGHAHIPRASTVYDAQASLTGYATVAVMGLEGGDVTFALRKLGGGDGTVMAGGTILNSSKSEEPVRSANDALGTVRWGLVYKALSAFDLLDFNVGSFVSPVNDTIDVHGPRQIPSNIVLPKQSILMGAVKLNKPHYRLPVFNGVPVHLAAIQGEVDATSMAGHLDIGLLNKLRVTKLALTDEMTPATDVNVDLTANITVTPRFTVTPVMPPFLGDVVVASAVDVFGDRTAFVLADGKCAFNSASPNVLNSPGRGIQTVSLNTAGSKLGGTRRDDLITVAVGSDGTVTSGIISEGQGRDVYPGEFLNPVALATGRPLPETLAVQAGPRQIDVVVLNSQKTGTLAFAFVLPAAGQADVPLTNLAHGLTVESYALMTLEFAARAQPFPATPLQVDGNTVMQSLTRFTRSYADVSQTGEF